MTVVDARYYEATAPKSLSEKVLVWAREAMYRDFDRLVAPTATDKILDVGVSDVINDGANMLEWRYPHRKNITAAGLGEGALFRAAYPEAAYRQIQPGAALPFADRQFDIAVSNAVIEHTGSREAQKAFVAELARVAQTVFLTAPNRWFPIEHHTALPLAHYHPATFALGCRLTDKALWLDPAELILTGPADLRAAAPKARKASFGYTGLKLGPFSSNIYMVLRGD